MPKSGPTRTTIQQAVVARMLGCRSPVVVAATIVRHAEAERPPDVDQPGVIASRLEPVACIEKERLELIRRPSDDHEAVVNRHGAGERLGGLVPASRARTAASSATCAARAGSCKSAAARSSSAWTSSLNGRVRASARSSKPAAARYVLSVERPLSGSYEAIPGAERERGIGLARARRGRAAACSRW